MIRPHGVFAIKELEDIKSVKQKQFQFTYAFRTFEFFCESHAEANMWVIFLQFLNEHFQLDQDPNTLLAQEFFKKMKTFMEVVSDRRVGKWELGSTIFNVEADDTGKEKKVKKMYKFVQSSTAGKLQHRDYHKMDHVSAEQYKALVNARPDIGLGYHSYIRLSLQALRTKNIWNYLKAISPKLMRSRVIFGYLRKRARGKFKYFMSRWYFMISQRPLNMQDFISDEEILPESVLPPLFEFNTIYHYYMETMEDKSGQQGQIRTKDIVKIDIKRMDDSNTESGHAFLLDCGTQKYHLNTQYKFEMERWVEAIVISMQTAREATLSLTGACKNVAKLVTAFDI